MTYPETSNLEQDADYKVPVPASEADTVLAMIERAARDPQVDIAKMREFLTLRREMMAVEAERQFNVAMTAAQMEMQPLTTNADNPQTRSRYVTFGALDAAIRPIYTKHGFNLSWDSEPLPATDHVRLICLVSHNAGHTRTYRLDMPADGKGAKGGDVMTKTHATGSAVTYGRRYLEAMIFNLAVIKDDDGDAAGREDPNEKIDAMRVKYLNDMIKTANADERKVLDFVKGDSVATLTVAQFKKAEIALRGSIAKQRKGRA